MEPLSEQSDAVTRLYEILTRANLSVAFTKKVLVRPPFPFLHKVCTEALGRSGIFSHEQLTLGNLTTREQKAGFLVRALAFVAFTLRAIQADCVSILLFVSPVQVLAGFEVDRTHEFLRQLVLVHQLSDMDGIKASAAAEVQLKGENHLYTMAIKFRRGLTKAQAAVRLFLRNRAMTTTDGNNNDPTPPVPGTKFLKVFEGFGTFEGVVRSATDGVYVVYYAQDGDEEELDEQEMLEVLRQSRQLEAASSVVAPPQVESSADPSPPNTRTVEFVPVNLFGDLERELPSRQQQEVTRNTPSVSPSRNAAAATASKQLAALMQCDGLVSQGSPSQPGEVLLGDKSDLFRIALPKPATANASNNDGTSPQPNVGEPLWRQKLLALVHPNGVAAIPNPTTLQHASSNPMVLTPPTLPKIAVPGGLSKWSKRLKQPTDNAFRDNINVIKPKATRTTNQHASPPKAKDSNSSKSFAAAKPPPQSDDSLFETSYQLSNDRTHQTVVLRAIVKRIDKYLRRKRMRVIDLFRYCDFDHCGYITPGGMEEVLRQMDIRLPPAEMEMFMMHLDTNKNGVIDVDEFESLVRVHRRTDARRDQLRQELPHVLKLDPVSASPAPSHSSSIVPSSLLALKDQVLHAAHALDPDATGTVAAAPLAKAIGGLTVPKIPSDVVESFVAMCRPLHGLVVVADIERVLAGPIGKGGKKGNRFLDHTWLGQFDAQMEKVRGLGS